MTLDFAYFYIFYYNLNICI